MYNKNHLHIRLKLLSYYTTQNHITNITITTLRAVIFYVQIYPLATLSSRPSNDISNTQILCSKNMFWSLIKFVFELCKCRISEPYKNVFQNLTNVMFGTAFFDVISPHKFGSKQQQKVSFMQKTYKLLLITECCIFYVAGAGKCKKVTNAHRCARVSSTS